MTPQTFSQIRRAVSGRSLRSVFLTAFLTTFSAALVSAQAPRTPVRTRTAQIAATAVDAGVVPASQTVTVTATIRQTPERSAALDAYLTALTTAGSPSYHQWLTPAQFAASYGATPEQVDSVSAWAAAQGLTVASVSAGGNRVALTGTADHVQAAFASTLHTFQLGGAAYLGNIDQPSLDQEGARLFSSVEGLDTLPSSSNMQLGIVASPFMPDGLGQIVDANLTPVLQINSSVCLADLSVSESSAYAAIFRQAAAQGITVLSTRGCQSGAFPAGLPEVTGVAAPGDAAESVLSTVARPAWQSAPGLPADAVRHVPDVTVSSVSALAQAIAQIAGGGRLGNLNPVLYELAPVAGLYTQPDAAPAGTWEPSTGLGLLDLGKLGTVFPRGTGSSFTSFSASNYSPIHGQGTTFTSSVTSGTGGATPTGTVSFVTAAGTVLGKGALVSGSASVTLTNLDGGNYTLSAVYSGDAVYASSSSPTAQLFVQPEPSALSVTVSGSPIVGSSFTLTVTDTAPSGVGQPTGGVNVSVSGTSTSYTGTLAPAGPASGAASFTIPATTVGTITLAVTCTTSANYSCYNPYTTTVTIQKATPTLSISYSPNPPVSGSTITLNGVVSTIGNAPAPTGNVRFFDNGTLLNASALTNGSTTTTGQVPTTSTHAISATYDGDPNYNSVSTTAGSTTSGTITTTLGLTASSATAGAGQNITFTATLTATATGPAAPTGSVTFFDGSTQIGTANLIGNAASFMTSTLSPSANHSITAIYSGDGYYGTSTSPAVAISRSNTANQSVTTLNFSPSAPVHGQTVTLAATVAAVAGGATPTGTVSFTSSQTGNLGMGTLQNGVASLTTNQLPGGMATISATYNGDTTYNPSTSSAAPLTVSPEPVTLAVSVPANATFGSAFSVLVSVTGQSGVAYPTGTVTVQPQGTGYSAASTGSVTSSGATSSGSAAVTVQATGAGSITFTATYAGDRNFAAAGPVSTTATVAKAASSTALTFNPTAPVAGQSTTLTAHVSFAGAIAPSGSVQFLDGMAVLGTATLDQNGNATLATVFASGNHIVSAAYGGDTNYAASTSVARNTSTGTTATTTNITVNPSSVTVGTAVTLGATVGPTVNGTAPSGTVQFLGGGNILCTATLSNGSGTCSYTPAAANTLSVTGNYAGDANYAASTSPATTLTTNYGNGTLAASVNPASGAGGTSATVTATVTAPSGTVPSGTITATVTSSAGAAIAVYSTTLPGTGTGNTATVMLPISIPAAPGAYNIAVSCSNTNFSCTVANLSLASTGATKIATTTLLTATAATGTTSSTNLVATITAASAGASAASGTVVFYDGTMQIGIGILTAGQATASVTLAGTTAHSLTAVYSGDTLYAGSVSPAITGTSTAGTTAATISLTVNPTSGLAGQAVVFTANLTGLSASGAVPTGTVSFYAVGTTSSLLGTVTIGKSGANQAQGVFSTANLPAGTTSVYAVYAGDTNFLTVTSSNVSIGLTDYNVTFIPQSLTLTAGKSGQATLILGIVNGFSGTVTFGCTPPPNTSITCSFSPTVLTGGGSTTLTLNTVAPKSARSRGTGLRVVSGVSFAALLCCLIPGSRRRRMPALLLVLLGFALAANTGCSDNSFDAIGTLSGGTPLGTVTVVINTAGSDGVNTVKHNYSFGVTIQ